MKTELQRRWKEVKLDEVTKVDSGQGAPQGESWFTGDKIFVRAGDLNKLSEGIFVGDYCEKITDDAVKKYSLILYPKNSVVFPKSGMSIATENIAILKYDSYVVNHLAIIEAGNLIDSKYLYYLFKKLKILNLVRNKSYPSIRISDIKNLKILWPDKEIRREIVSILEKVEKLKAMREEADKLTKEYLKAVFLRMFGDPATNPFKWKVTDLASICKRITDGTHQSPEFAPDGIPFLFVSNIVEGKINFSTKNFISQKTYEELTRTKPIEQNDILYSTVGSYGVAVLVDTERKFAFQRHIGHIKPNEQLVNSLFLKTLLNTTFILNQAHKHARGVAQKTLNLSEIRKFQVILPPKNLQNKFVSIVKEIERFVEYQKQSKEHIHNLFDNLMQRTLKGEITC